MLYKHLVIKDHLINKAMWIEVIEEDFKSEFSNDLDGLEVLGYHPDWIDEDFNADGTRIGFFTQTGTEDLRFISAKYCNEQDRYCTIGFENEEEDKIIPTHYYIIPSTVSLIQEERMGLMEEHEEDMRRHDDLNEDSSPDPVIPEW
jgi:hypothetical protein